MHAFLMGCVCMKLAKKPRGDDDPTTLLAAETAFTMSEVQALRELFRKLSSSITGDGLINKEVFRRALNSNQKNLFADRVFALFDLKHNGVIDFEEFVRSLSVFHPNAPESEKITFAFRLYDLRDAGYIERSETFREADSKGDGRIDLDEWKAFVEQNPTLLKNMTLPYLKEITLAFPSFVFNSEVEDSKMDG